MLLSEWRKQPSAIFLQGQAPVRRGQQCCCTRYVVYSLVCSYLVCGFIPCRHRGGPEMPCLHHNLGLSQNPTAGVPSMSVPTGLSRHSHQLQLRLYKKKKTKQTENSARMHSIEGNNNINTTTIIICQSRKQPSRQQY